METKPTRTARRTITRRPRTPRTAPPQPPPVVEDRPFAPSCPNGERPPEPDDGRDLTTASMAELFLHGLGIDGGDALSTILEQAIHDLEDVIGDLEEPFDQTDVQISRCFTAAYMVQRRLQIVAELYRRDLEQRKAVRS